MYYKEVYATYANSISIEWKAIKNEHAAVSMLF